MEVALTVGDAEVTPVHLAKFGVSRVADGPWKSSCDYLLVCEAASGTHVILVELKKTLAEEDSKAKEQLRRSLPVWRYPDALCLVEAGAHGMTTYPFLTLPCSSGPRCGFASRRHGSPLEECRKSPTGRLSSDPFWERNWTCRI